MNGSASVTAVVIVLLVVGREGFGRRSREARALSLRPGRRVVTPVQASERAWQRAEMKTGSASRRRKVRSEVPAACVARV